MTAYDWDSTIQHDGSDFKLLPEGRWPFTIKRVEKSYYNGGRNIQPCPKANVTLRVGYGSDMSDVTDGLLLDTALEWKLCQFFRSINARKHGEALKMNWEDAFLIGKKGWVDIEHRNYEKDGETKQANQVVSYVDPQDWPADGKPILKNANGGDDAADEW